MSQAGFKPGHSAWKALSLTNRPSDYLDSSIVEKRRVARMAQESSLGYSSQKLVNSISFGDHSVTFFSAIQWKQRTKL